MNHSLKQELKLEAEKVMDFSSDQISLRNQLDSCRNDLAQSNKMIDWLNLEMEGKSNQLGEYRKEKVNAHQNHMDQDTSSDTDLQLSFYFYRLINLNIFKVI